MLEGGHGGAAQLAMRVVTRFGRVAGAQAGVSSSHHVARPTARWTDRLARFAERSQPPLGLLHTPEAGVARPFQSDPFVIIHQLSDLLTQAPDCRDSRERCSGGHLNLSPGRNPPQPCGGFRLRATSEPHRMRSSGGNRGRWTTPTPAGCPRHRGDATRNHRPHLGNGARALALSV